MLEKQRLIYLDSLGISNYMPRYVLPYALPSQLLSDELLQEPTAFSTADISDDTHPPSVELDSVSTAPMVDAVNPLADILSVAKDGKVKEEKAIVQDEKASQREHTLAETEDSTASRQPLQFTLSIWRIHDDLLVVDSRQPGAALPTDKLLQNILRSIGYHLAQLPASELLRWPLFKSSVLNKQSSEDEQAEARAMVQAYISAQCTKVPTKTLLLLGQNAVNFVLAPDVNAESFFEKNKGTAVTLEQWQTTAIITPSLVDMLQEPLQKRVTWTALQTLLTT